MAMPLLGMWVEIALCLGSTEGQSRFCKWVERQGRFWWPERRGRF